jgi:glycerol transport system ATP-binding protein|tara:strand:+ start:49674 stop:50744 length:1071 start_codon:yes stop_codon:yes gene_type:complete
MAKITLSNLAHSYLDSPTCDDDYALKTLSHEWEDGAAYALLGPSGCGKTTLLNLISGLLTPSEGQILFDDNDVTLQETAARNIAQVFQFPVIYDTMTVRENLAFPLKNRGMSKEYIDRRVLEIADAISLNGILGKKASGLTADIKQKISLGRGLVREDVSAILFDEPLTVIDPHMKWQLRTQLKEIHKNLGHTMIYVTHDQTEALTFADKVIVMSEGEVVQIGTPADLFERPAHTFVGYFIGSPGMNVLPINIKDDTAVLGGHKIMLGTRYKDLAGKIELGIRPEFASLSNDPDALPVTIKRIEDVGHYKIARTRFEDHDINIILNEGDAITPDMNRVTFDRARINIYQDNWLVAP